MLIFESFQVTVARVLLPVLSKELDHLSRPMLIRRPREVEVRATCGMLFARASVGTLSFILLADTCMTSIFSGCWMCTACGREVCGDCHSSISELPPSVEIQSKPPPAANEERARRWKLLVCSRGSNARDHHTEDFLPVSRFDQDGLARVVAAMQEVLALGSTPPPPPELPHEGCRADTSPVMPINFPAGQAFFDLILNPIPPTMMPHNTLSPPEGFDTSLKPPPIDTASTTPLPIFSNLPPIATLTFPPPEDTNLEYRQTLNENANNPHTLNHPSQPHFNGNVPRGNARFAPINLHSRPHKSTTPSPTSSQNLYVGPYAPLAILQSPITPSKPPFALSLPPAPLMSSYDHHDAPPTYHPSSDPLVHPPAYHLTYLPAHIPTRPPSRRPARLPRDPAGLASHPILTFNTDNLTEEIFRPLWAKGEPLIVTDLLKKFNINWSPEYFIREYGAQECQIVNCETDQIVGTTVGKFFRQFGRYEDRRHCWKLKVSRAVPFLWWQPGADILLLQGLATFV